MKHFKNKRRDKLRLQPFPDTWRQTIARNVPLCRRLPAVDREELHGHIHVMLAEKTFEGCAGVEVTDEMRITILAQAAVLLLHREPDYFPALKSILVYPSAYVAPVTDMDNGVVTEFHEERAGETWEQGSMVLSWNDVTGTVGAVDDDGRTDDPERPGSASESDDEGELVPAYNVVLHEFAHHLDYENGELDGMPALPSREVRERWVEVMESAYEQLASEYDGGVDAVIDEYALEAPDEFFAVAVESFFETPFAILEEYPRLYEILSDYFQQDPAGWRATDS